MKVSSAGRAVQMEAKSHSSEILLFKLLIELVRETLKLKQVEIVGG